VAETAISKTVSEFYPKKCHIPNVESSRDVRRRNRDDEVAGWLHLAISGKFRLKELLLLPPVVPSGFNNLKIVSDTVLVKLSR
jgi:hypothetical protein